MTAAIFIPRTGPLGRAAAAIAEWQNRRAAEKMLRSFSARELADLGLSLSDCDSLARR
ncbi:DUF1127 domain-containing protein [Aestuariibius sp. 2305UL40-4]|uniref:DUF1127 domain-containing protein n=1 Tax=Aestuariibius violaceus TaxID=3234132 RepID=UPI00345E78AB